MGKLALRHPQGVRPDGCRQRIRRKLGPVVASTVRVTRTLRGSDPLTETDIASCEISLRFVTNMGINLTTTRSRRMTAGAVALCITGGAVAITATTGASASTPAAQAAAVNTTAAAVPQARTEIDIRARNLRKYGFHPLSRAGLNERKIAKYKLRKKHVKEIKKAKKNSPRHAKPVPSVAARAAGTTKSTLAMVTTGPTSSTAVPGNLTAADAMPAPPIRLRSSPRTISPTRRGNHVAGARGPAHRHYGSISDTRVALPLWQTIQCCILINRMDRF